MSGNGFWGSGCVCISTWQQGWSTLVRHRIQLEKARNVQASPFVYPACNLVIGRVGFIVGRKKRFVNVIDCPVVLEERQDRHRISSVAAAQHLGGHRKTNCCSLIPYVQSGWIVIDSHLTQLESSSSKPWRQRLSIWNNQCQQSHHLGERQSVNQSHQKSCYRTTYNRSKRETASLITYESGSGPSSQPHLSQQEIMLNLGDQKDHCA